MPLTADGVQHLSTKEAAAQLGGASNTLCAYIRKGVLLEVTMQVVGTRQQRGFTDEWTAEARATLRQIAEKR